MGIIASKLNHRVTPVIDIRDDETVLSTSAISFQSSSTSSLQNHLLNKFIVIWLDANVNSGGEIYKNSMNRLQRIASAMQTFTNINDCLQYLDRIKNDKVLMVISNEFVPKIWPKIRTMTNIHSMYIISQTGEPEKILDLGTNVIKPMPTVPEPVRPVIKRDYSSYPQDSLTLSIIPSLKYTKKNLNTLNRLFTYWMMVRSITGSLSFDRDTEKEAIRLFMELSREQFSTNANQLKIIDEFELNYHQHSPIWWYTRNCFVKLMLDRAFQSQDLEILYRMGFFLRDLQAHLERLQPETLKNHKLPIVVYRAHNATNEDFEKIRSIQGNLLSFNNFIMADTNSEPSFALARTCQSSNNSVGLIFRIKIETKHTFTPYVSLQNLGYSSDLNTFLLFSMHSIFRINEFIELENRLWQIDLTLTANNDEQVRCLNDVLKETTHGSTGWFKLPDLMTSVRDYDQAKQLYYTLLHLTPETEFSRISRIYNELGNIEDCLGEYASALVYYQKAIEIRQQHLPANHRSLSVPYNNIGEAQRQLGDYFSALSTHQKTLMIKKQNLPADDLSIATTYNNIALASESLGEFSSALEFHQKALTIKLKTLPADHQDIGTAYNNIGDLQRSMGNFKEALGNLQKALNIRLKKYSPDDTSLAVLYNNIGLIHRELGDYDKALRVLQRSLEIKRKNLSAHHPSLTYTYNNIGDINQQIGKYTDALVSYQKALDIQLKVFSEHHPEVATTYTNIGVAHQSMGQYSTALQFYQKAIKIRQKALPAHHPSLGTCYNNIGHVYQLLGEYNTALEYYQKTLKLQEKSLRTNHPSLAATYNNLADVQRKQGNLTKALNLYKKSLEIKKKNLSPDHPSLIITYNNIGVIHQASKNYSAALEAFKQTLEIQRKTLSSDHPDLAAVYNNMGVVFQSMKEYPNALEYYKKALTIQEKVLPADHPDTATTHNSMATVYIYLSDIKSAFEHEKRAVNIATKTLPADHPNLQTFRNNLDRLKARMDMDSKE